jgi:hypothetical protein
VATLTEGRARARIRKPQKLLFFFLSFWQHKFLVFYFRLKNMYEMTDAMTTETTLGRF